MGRVSHALRRRSKGARGCALDALARSLYAAPLRRLEVCVSALFPLLLIASLLIGSPAGADSRADGHAPIGVMGDHTHHAGELMLSYRFGYMQMSGNRSRSTHQSPGDVLERGFAATPLEMDMQMHGFGLMVAPTDWVTVMAMLPVIDLGMDHLNVMGRRFRTRSDGIGDLRVGGLWPVWKRGGHRLHLNTGVSFPTGSIRHKDDLPGSPGRVRLPYPMQIGSGSYALIPGLTYRGETSALSWGGQAQGVLFLDENDNDYRLGDRAELTAWLARPWAPWLSTSVRLAWSYWGNVRGADPRLNPNLVPTADPDRRGGHRLDVLPGLNLELPLGALGRHRFAIELGLPVYQWLHGPQLETDWRLVVGWQHALQLFPD
jgi:hypothetical protein